jgi:hypothetical protein
VQGLPADARVNPDSLKDCRSLTGLLYPAKAKTYSSPLHDQLARQSPKSKCVITLKVLLLKSFHIPLTIIALDFAYDGKLEKNFPLSITKKMVPAVAAISPYAIRWLI